MVGQAFFSRRKIYNGIHYSHASQLERNVSSLRLRLRWSSLALTRLFGSPEKSQGRLRGFLGQHDVTEAL